MLRSFSLLVLVVAVTLLGPAATAAQDATPAASPVAGSLASSADLARTDLAAMALSAGDLPPDFANVDERYFLTAQGVSTFFTNQGIGPEEIASVGLQAMYDSFYAGPDDALLYLYIAEFGSPAEVEAGFGLLEDEARTIGEAELLAHQDLPGPDIGADPSETTMAVVDFSMFGGPVVDRTELNFRVENYLIGVSLEIPVEGADASGATPAVATPAEPDPDALQLVTDAATALEARIQAVRAGQTPSGVEATLPGLVLPTDHVWPRPGVTAEGYKDAAQILGSVGPAAELATDFGGGYGRTVAPGTGPDNLFPEPPFLTVGLSVFASPEAANGVLAAAADLPVPGPLPSPTAWHSVSAEAVPGADASAAFESAFEEGRAADSARVVVVVGEWLATIDVQGAESAEVALAIAADLAAQQAACLSAGGACTTLVPPPALAANAVATPAP